MDLGSNSFHLVIADVHPDGSLTPVSGEKEMLRLGDVVSREGLITPEAADAAVATMRRFRLMAEAAGATEILACATSALRSATNGDEVLDRIAEEAGIEADAIDGIEEARLIFTAIRAAVAIDPAPAVCFDLGGGSLEIMVGDSGLHLGRPASGSASPGSATSSSAPTPSTRRTGAGSASTSSRCSDRGPSRSPSSSPRWPSAAAAPSRTSRT